MSEASDMTERRAPRHPPHSRVKTLKNSSLLLIGWLALYLVWLGEVWGQEETNLATKASQLSFLLPGSLASRP